MITITETAATRIIGILAEENSPTSRLRMFVQGGGCSGFSYGFTIDNVVNEDDTAINESNVPIVIDSMSYQYLVGCTLDYEETLMNSQFVIKNPNSSSTCGCGSSFSV